MSKLIQSVREMNAQKSMELVLRKRMLALSELWSAYHKGTVSWGETQRQAEEKGLDLWS